MTKTKFVPPIACVEVLLRHPALPASLDAVPALPPHPAADRHAWTFRPSVLATLIDALAGRSDGNPRTDYRYENDAGVAVLVEPTGQTTPMPRVSDDLPHCPPPPVVNRALDPARWTVADDQPTPALDETADTRLAVLASPDRRDSEQTYVRAAPDIEELDPDTWVIVSALWTVPARRGLLVVPAGLVALYEPESDAHPMPTTFADDEAWLPDCPHCGELLFDSSCIPGMYYPQPDLGPDDSPWCPKHPRCDRPRPHAATWRLVTQ